MEGRAVNVFVIFFFIFFFAWELPIDFNIVFLKQNFNYYSAQQIHHHLYKSQPCIIT